MGVTKVQLALAIASAAQPDRARARLEMALAEARDTGMCFYHAELLRLRAHTDSDHDARELARRQSAPLPELRAVLDDFDLRGQPARPALADAADRVPADSALPELARAQAILAELTSRTAVRY